MMHNCIYKTSDFFCFNAGGHFHDNIAEDIKDNAKNEWNTLIIKTTQGNKKNFIVKFNKSRQRAQQNSTA